MTLPVAMIGAWAAAVVCRQPVWKYVTAATKQAAPINAWLSLICPMLFRVSFFITPLTSKINLLYFFFNNEGAARCFLVGLMGRRLAARVEEPETGAIIATRGWREQTVFMTPFPGAAGDGKAGE